MAPPAQGEGEPAGEEDEAVERVAYTGEQERAATKVLLELVDGVEKVLREANLAALHKAPTKGVGAWREYALPTPPTGRVKQHVIVDPHGAAFTRGSGKQYRQVLGCPPTSTVTVEESDGDAAAASSESPSQ
eukprot:g2304.t1